MSNPVIAQRLDRVLSEYPLAYFQNADTEGVFPEKFFRALGEQDALTYDLTEAGASLIQFARLAARIGEKSIASAICWVMHNQQYDCIVRAGKQHLVSRKDLIASVTTQPDSALLTRSGYLLEPNAAGGYSFLREAPVVSFGHVADYYVATLSRSAEYDDVWLCLLDRSHVREASTEPSNAASCRSTQNQRMLFSGELSAERLLIPMREILKSAFAPIAHVGWMASYYGGVRGVLARHRKQLREKQGFRGRSWEHPLIVQRVGTMLSKLDACQAFIEYVASGIDDGRSQQLSRHTNSLKSHCSELLSEVVDAMKVELGMSCTIVPGDALGFEMVRRDIDCARLMFHNDKLYEYIYNDWLLCGDRQ